MIVKNICVLGFILYQTLNPTKLKVNPRKKAFIGKIPFKLFLPKIRCRPCDEIGEAALSPGLALEVDGSKGKAPL
jgi:hypothetical protein